jgi:hypothetical protein
MGSQDQRRAPVRASKARTIPRSTSTARLSPIDEPVTTTSPAMAGAEVTWYWPRSRRSTPRVRSTCPLVPKSEHGGR